MNPVYTREQLESYNRTQLWALCRERGLKCYPKSANCVEAICKAQQSVEKVAVAEVVVDSLAVAQTVCFEYELSFESFEGGLLHKEVFWSSHDDSGRASWEHFEKFGRHRVVSCQKTGSKQLLDEQVSAQTELKSHIEAQAQAVAPEIQTVEITFYDHEIYANGKQIANITHESDDFQTQRWVVMVGETEIHRADSWAKCHSYIQWHYKQGTLQAFLSIDSYLNEKTTSEIEPTEVIEIDEYKLVYAGGKSPRNYLVYKNDVLRGMIWQHISYWSNGIDNVRHNQPIGAASGLDTLIDVEETPASFEELLDRPFDELTTAEWQFIKHGSELVAA